MGFTENQNKVIEHGKGTLLVKAGPGSGKTTAIIARIMHLINNGVDPESFLVITFTNKAADNKKSIEDGTSYAIKSDKNSTRIKIVVTDLSSYNPQKNEIKGAINDLMDSVNSTDKHRYNIGDTKGYSFYSENTEKYVIVTNYKNKIYMSSYTDEESLKVLNTIQFK